jgi:hypothetical protein
MDLVSVRREIKSSSQIPEPSNLAHKGQYARRFVGIARILGTIRAGLVVVIDLPEERLADEREAAKVVLLV